MNDYRVTEPLRDGRERETLREIGLARSAERVPQSRPRVHAGPSDDLPELRSQVRSAPSTFAVRTLSVLFGDDVLASLFRVFKGCFEVRAEQREQRNDAVCRARVSSEKERSIGSAPNPHRPR